MQRLMSLQGKVAIVTGASSGIGAATARLFAAEGAKVVINARSADKLAEVASSIEGNVHQVVGDITKEYVQNQVVDDAIKKFGRLDILVNNAGMNVVSPVDVGKEVDTSDQIVQSTTKQFLGLDTYDRQFDVNVRQVIGVTTRAIPHLVKTKGNIINISSAASKRAVPGSTVYCMSKVALDMFTACLCTELGPHGVRINAVNPGAVQTNFMVAAGADPKFIQERAAGMIARYPLRRVGQADEIADAIMFLASDKAAFITGQTLGVDGGVIHAV